MRTAFAATLIAAAIALPLAADAPALAAAAPAASLPVFERDPNWPQLPDNFRAPFVSGIHIAPDGNAWLTTRPSRAQPDAAKTLGPPLMIVDPNGKYLRGWGGPGPGYEWPASEHNINIDYKGFVWVLGDSCKGRTSPVDDDQILKFTQDGKFVLQVGHSSAGKDDNDTENFRRPPNLQVDPQTNEVFVADGYGNHRIIVIDGDSGKIGRAHV